MPLDPAFWEEPPKDIGKGKGHITHIGDVRGPYRCGITELPKGHMRIRRLPEMVHPDDRCPDCYHDYTGIYIQWPPTEASR